MVKENGIDSVKEVCRMALLLEGRKNEDLAETEGVGGRGEGVCENVEEAVTDQNGMSFRRGEEGEKEPAIVGVRVHDDFARSVDEPVAQRLHVVEESDRLWRGKGRSREESEKGVQIHGEGAVRVNAYAVRLKTLFGLMRRESNGVPQRSDSSRVSDWCSRSLQSTFSPS